MIVLFPVTVAGIVLSIWAGGAPGEGADSPVFIVPEDQFDPGYPSEEDLAHRFSGIRLDTPCYVSPQADSLVAPELGPPAAGRFVATRRYMVARWRLEALYQHYNDTELFARHRSASKKLGELTGVLARERLQREPTAGDPRFERFTRLRQARGALLIAPYHKEVERLVAEHGLVQLRMAAFVGQRPEAKTRWEQAVSTLPELAEAIERQEVAVREGRDLDRQIEAVLTDGGTRPLLSPEQAAELNRLQAESQESLGRCNQIRFFANVAAARHELWQIGHDEYQRQEAEFQQFARQFAERGQVEPNPGFLRQAYESQVWERERPQPRQRGH